MENTTKDAEVAKNNITDHKIETYPKVANYDDKITTKEEVLFDIFVLGESFSHIELSENTPFISEQGYDFQLREGELYVNGELWETFHGRKKGETIADEDSKIVEVEEVDVDEVQSQGHKKDIVALHHKDLNVFSIELLKEPITLSSASCASIAIVGDSFAVLEPIFGSTGEVENYYLSASASGEVCYFNGYVIEEVSQEFKIGDRLVIGGISIERRTFQFKITGITKEIVFTNSDVTPSPFISEYPPGFPEYRRSPRIILVPPDDKITISQPESVPTGVKSQLLRTLVPPIGMICVGILMVVFIGRNPIMMVGMAGISVMTAAITVSAHFANKKELKQKKIDRVEDYESYLVGKQAKLNQLEAEQRKALSHHHPSMSEIAEMVFRYNPRIYEKTINHDDFLEISLGLGTVSTSYTIDFDENEQSKDELVGFARNIVMKRKELEQAPVATSLKEQTIGLAGSPSVLRSVVSTILFQIAVFHSYRDVEFVALVPEEAYGKDWRWWRWLPHFKVSALNLRGFIHNGRSRDIVLNSFLQIMTKRRQAVKDADNEEVRFSPHYILTILDDNYLVGHGLNEFLAEDMSQYGVTVIWCKDAPSLLPETVTTMINYFSSQSAELVNENEAYVAKRFVPNYFPKELQLSTVIQRLANLHHTEVEKNAIPEAITFLEMYNVKKVEELGVKERWAKANTAKTLSVPLGVRGKDDIVDLNLHERAHGPHGLIAGTTGSGKSEIVQSYVLSLAVNFAPEDVGFLPIDFKGGGMANEFKHLPHLLGSITNLDGAGSARALASIRAELRKRQRLFGQYGVNHINAYTKLYKQGKGTMVEDKEKYPTKPLPHLFLISDEFAELKANEPEFMTELVSTARIGRSLGVHLILATQKPSGVVDDQIWSNSRFKIALKVADTSDSNEIIKCPDAASITQPGRAYLQVGNNEIFELFQSAWSGATYDPSIKVEEKIDERIWLINDLGQYQLLTIDLSEEDEEMQKTSGEEDLPTELKAVVNHIAKLCKKENVILPEKPWLPPLERNIVTPYIDRKSMWKKKRNLAVPIALMDMPAAQSQEDFIYNIEELSHTAIHGSAGFGKSTILQTLVMNLARQNNPSQVQFNLLDFGTNGLLPLKDLPHVVDLAPLEDVDKVLKFTARIRKELSKRKELFTQAGVASISQYEAKVERQLPIVLNIVDGYDSMRENYLEEDVESTMNQLLRDGASVGMYLVITGLRSDTFRMNMTSNIPTRISLFLVEENSIKDVVGRDALISEEIAGRGQIKLDEPFVLQFYLASEGDNDLERLVALEKEVGSMEDEWSGERPIPIPMVPRVLSRKGFFRKPEVLEYLANGNIPMGLDLETTNVVGFRPNEDKFFVLADNDMSQSEYLEETIFEGLRRLDGVYERIVFDGQERLSASTDVFDRIVNTDEFANYILDIYEMYEGRVNEISERNGEMYSPMLIYVSDTTAFADKSFISQDKLRKLLRGSQSVNMHFMFQGDKVKIETGFDEVHKLLRSVASAGMVGSKMNEQSFVKVKANYGEPIVEHDQHHYFNGRFIGRIKLASQE